MGGIGKTTLAGQLFNSLQPGFQDEGQACTLSNVRNKASRAGGVLKLQRELLQALSGSSYAAQNEDSGAPRSQIHSIRGSTQQH